LFHSDLPQAMIAGVQGDVIQSTTSSMFAHWVYHCGWAPLWPSDPEFSQNWKPRTGDPTIPGFSFRMIAAALLGAFKITGNPHTTQLLIINRLCDWNKVTFPRSQVWRLLKAIEPATSRW
jgi:hypothetical protein